VKMIRCDVCADVVALAWKRWRDCVCGESGGEYNEDGDTITIVGRCRVYGVDGRVFLGRRSEAFPYPEHNGKVTRIERAANSRHAQGE
jgi:hypothetical protein